MILVGTIVSSLMCVFVGCILVAGLLWMVRLSKRGGGHKRWVTKALARQAPGMGISHLLECPSGRAVLVIDEGRQWCAALQKSRTSVVFGFAQLVGAEVVEDGHSVTQTSRGSQLAGAAIGGALFGGVGMVVGAVTGGKTTRQKVSSVQVRITIDNLQMPYHEVEFLEFTFKRDHPFVQNALKAANQWVAALQVVMQRASRPIDVSARRAPGR